MLSREEYLFRVENDDGDMDKNTANEVVTPRKLQAGVLLETFNEANSSLRAQLSNRDQP